MYRTHWNVVLQEILCYLGLGQEHRQFPGQNHSDITSQRESQKRIARIENLSEGSDPP